MTFLVLLICVGLNRDVVGCLGPKTCFCFFMFGPTKLHFWTSWAEQVTLGELFGPNSDFL